MLLIICAFSCLLHSSYARNVEEHEVYQLAADHLLRHVNLSFGMFTEYAHVFKQHSNEGGWVDEAFVMFSTASHFPLVQAVLSGFHAFSTRPVILYEVGSLTMPTHIPPVIYTKVIGRWMHLPKGMNVWFAKLAVAVASRVRYAVIAEADSMPFIFVDRLFSLTIRTCHNLPVLVRHEWGDFSSLYTVGPHCAAPTMHWGHAHMLWCYKSLPAIAELFVKSTGGMYVSDEQALNCFLWQHRGTVQVCAVDPYSGYYYNFVKGDRLRHFDSINNGMVYAMYYFHGFKDASQMRMLLSDMIALHAQGNFTTPFYFNGSLYTGSHEILRLSKHACVL
jgi:hypothetical protein